MKLPLAGGKYRKPARIIAMLLGYSGLALWFYHFYVWYQYDGTRPRIPDAMSGRVLPQNTHGHVVYLTVGEQSRLRNIAILAGILLMTGILSGILFSSDHFWRKRPKPWEVRRW